MHIAVNSADSVARSDQMPDTDPDSEFVLLYLDDTDEQLDQLDVILAAWDEDRRKDVHATHMLRLIHAMEGAAGALGFENVRAATKYFDREVVRSREDTNLAITPLSRYVEILRDCNRRLRRGETLGSSKDLVEQLKSAGRE